MKMNFAGEERQIAIESLLPFLRMGAEFASRKVNVHHDELQVSLHVARGTATALLLCCGFQYGHRNKYPKVGVKWLRDEGIL